MGSFIVSLYTWKIKRNCHESAFDSTEEVKQVRVSQM